MSLFLTFVLVLVVGLVAFVAGRARALSVDDGAVKAHSRAHYHGAWAMLLAVLPALAFLFFWSIGSGSYLENRIETQLQAQTGQTSPVAGTLVRSLAGAIQRIDAAPPATMAELAPLVAGKGVSLAPDTQDYMIPIAVDANASAKRMGWIGGLAALAIAAFGGFYGIRQIAVRQRARDKVEKVMLGTLFSASTIAILTTIGIVLSMLFQTITFFSEISPLNFFFGTVWDPRFAAAGSDRKSVV